MDEIAMQTFFSDQKVEWGDYSLPSIFLAGPTPRNDIVQSWRMDAIRLLNEWGFKGQLLIPERHNWTRDFDYLDQVEWEHAGLERATIIAFWVPSDPTNLPALTTRVEFGGYVKSNPDRCVYGRPKDSYRTRYLDWWYNKYTQRSPHRTLETTLEETVLQAHVSQDHLSR